MEIKQKTTLSIIKRILSPIKDNPGMFFRAVLQPTIWALFDIYLVRIFKSIATDIQNGADLLKIKFYAIQLGVVVFFYCIWKWFSRHFGWVQMNYRQPMIIRKRYFPKYFVLEPTYVEKV